MENHNFLPSVAIKPNYDNPPQFVKDLLISQTESGSVYKLDLQKMSQYISVVISMRRRAHDGNIWHMVKFRYCTVEDFTSRGVKVDEAFKTSILGRLCPDFKDDAKFYKVMNKYANETLRYSFAV